MLSIIIPSDKDPFLQKTIDSVLENAEGEIEIIVVLDGFLQDIKKSEKVCIVHLKKNRGMRGAINAGLEVAKGKFVMKLDSHCIVGKGFDKILAESCKDNWLMIPRRYALDEANWKRDELKPIRDYHYLSFPKKNETYGSAMFVTNDLRKTQRRRSSRFDIDDTMTFQGSCWFANREYFMEYVGFMDDREETYGSFAQDQIEIGLKYWLGGGAIKVNKKTWYAHLSKRKHHYDRGLYSQSYKKSSNVANNNWSVKHWMNNKEPNMIHPLSWLIEKFMPVPTWSEDRSLWVSPI